MPSYFMQCSIYSKKNVLGVCMFSISFPSKQNTSLLWSCSFFGFFGFFFYLFLIAYYFYPGILHPRLWRVYAVAQRSAPSYYSVGRFFSYRGIWCSGLSGGWCSYGYCGLSKPLFLLFLLELFLQDVNYPYKGVDILLQRFYYLLNSTLNQASQPIFLP